MSEIKENTIYNRFFDLTPKQILRCPTTQMLKNIHTKLNIDQSLEYSKEKNISTILGTITPASFEKQMK